MNISVDAAVAAMTCIGFLLEARPSQAANHVTCHVLLGNSSTCA
jgi:hypothetical protein